MLIAFGGTSRPVAFERCDELLEQLKTVLIDWPFAEVPDNGVEPEIRIIRQGRRYRLTAPWYDKPILETTSVSAISSLLVDVVWMGIEQAELLCLHCGAVEMAGRLVVFPSTYRSGKSTLIAGLAAAGVKVFTDDVLPFDGTDKKGVAPGVALRLRLPLPQRSTAAFRHFVEAHRGPDDGYYQYLDLPQSIYAGRGERAPIGALVMLERREEGPAAIAGAPKSLGLQRLIRQNFGRLADPETIVDRFSRIVEDVPCFTLTYSDVEDAVELVQSTFRTEPPTLAAASPAVRNSSNGSPRPPKNVRHAPTARYRRHPDVTIRTMDDEIFLVHPDNQTIFHLNPVGAGLWQLLSEPTAMNDAIEVYRALFPDQSAKALKRDLAALYVALKANDLIVLAADGD